MEFDLRVTDSFTISEGVKVCLGLHVAGYNEAGGACFVYYTKDRQMEMESVLNLKNKLPLDALIELFEKAGFKVYIGADFLDWIKGREQSKAILRPVQEVLSLLAEAKKIVEENWGKPKRGDYWEPQDEAKISKMWNNGAGVAAIATALGRGVSGVEGRMLRMGMGTMSWLARDERALIHEIFYGSLNSITEISKHMWKIPGMLASIIIQLQEEGKLDLATTHNKQRGFGWG